MTQGNEDKKPHDSVCPECGAPCGAGDNYCRACGAGLGSIESTPGHVGKSNLPFSFQLMILGGGLAVVTVLFFLYQEITHDTSAQSQDGAPVIDQAAMMQSPHDLSLPEDFESLVEMGNSQMDATSFAIAAECYRRALMLNPIAFDVRVDFAICLHRVGMSGRAVEELRQVCLVSPDHSMAFYNAGIIFREINQPDSAKVYLQQYLMRFPDGDQRENAQTVIRELSN